MKLRNKKTGEIQEIVVMPVVNGYPDEFQLVEGETSLEDFNETWEDYKPKELKEPLIMSKKIRKAIRAWADANEIETVEYDEYWVSFRRDDKTISFKDEDSCLGFYGLENSRDYTISELCGDDEK